MEESRGRAINGSDPEVTPSQRPGAPDSFANTTRRIQSDAESLAAHVKEAGGDLRGFLNDQMHRRPYATLAAAAGTGFVLGGGLSSKVTMLALGMATRLAMAMAAREMSSWGTQGAADPRSAEET